MTKICIIVSVSVSDIIKLCPANIKQGKKEDLSCSIYFMGTLVSEELVKENYFNVFYVGVYPGTCFQNY